MKSSKPISYYGVCNGEAVQIRKRIDGSVQVTIEFFDSRVKFKESVNADTLIGNLVNNCRGRTDVSIGNENIVLYRGILLVSKFKRIFKNN